MTCKCEDENVESSVVDNGNGTYELACTCTQTGDFEVLVQIGGVEVINSPVVFKFYSRTPNILKSRIIKEEGVTTATVGEAAFIRIKFYDQWMNHATPGADFRSKLKVGAALVKEKQKMNAADPQLECECTFVKDSENGESPDHDYEIKYVATTAGRMDMYVYGSLAGDERLYFAGSPFHVTVRPAAAHHAVQSNGLEVPMLKP